MLAIPMSHFTLYDVFRRLDCTDDKCEWRRNRLRQTDMQTVRQLERLLELIQKMAFRH